MSILKEQLIKIEKKLSSLDDELEKEKKFQALVEGKRINLLNLWNLVVDSEGAYPFTLEQIEAHTNFTYPRKMASHKFLKELPEKICEIELLNINGKKDEVKRELQKLRNSIAKS
ncbi:hypothetical protein [Photobacterium leiognathi]|uniref:hypothetical protein n=1 Tax=Photobacterium leiognathi TaxID=553611 RepID=UPI0029818BDE|nr:hypothetical protein [Photobacterium leiognathi]